MNIDCLSLSSHKIYGPKGIGAMFIRRKPKVRIIPLINGGGQERGIRSGTLSPALCVGFGKACEIALHEMENDRKHIKYLHDKLFNALKARIPSI